MIDLRLGDWRDVLAGVECDALIVDPPYGARTHAGHNAGVVHSPGYEPERVKSAASTSRWRALSYSHWTPVDVREFVNSWHPRVSGWICAMSCSDLSHVWRAEFERVGRVAFAPVACVIRAMSVRLAGDGPSNWCVYLNVARPRGVIDGARNGAYIVNRDPGHIGGKPLRLMHAIVRDYTQPGDLVCDPCAGYGTTLRAAVAHGRRAIGAEIDPETHAAGTIACNRVQSEMAL